MVLIKMVLTKKFIKLLPIPISLSLYGPVFRLYNATVNDVTSGCKSLDFKRNVTA